MPVSAKLGSNIIQLDIIDSTNHFAENLLLTSDVPEGLVVVANKQTSGKGLGSNTWQSQRGKNLTLSLVLRPHFLPPDHMFLLNKAISLGVLDLVKMYVTEKPCYIKWPNDIYVSDCKIAGILINNTIGGYIFESSVVGIGLNINQICFTQELKNPISLKHITKKDYVIKDVLHDLLMKLDECYDKLQAGFDIEKEYEMNLYRLNRKTIFLVNDKRISGTIRGVDNDGRLQIEIDNEDHFFNHGEISFMV